MTNKICRFASFALVVFLLPSSSESQNPAMQVSKRQTAPQMAEAVRMWIIAAYCS